MLRLKFSKLKQLCTSVLLPRLLWKRIDIKYANDFNFNRTVEQLCKARKSTDSGNKNEANEKQMQIIEKCFSENISETETKRSKEVHEIQDENIISPDFYKMKQCDKCESLISKIFNNKTDVTKNEPNILDAKVQSNTSKLEEEKLAQKIEIIDETPHVEAHAPKVEGFNAIPKVLGNESYTFEMSKQNNQTTPNNGEQINLDELAKRCMGAPVGEIDKILTQELKNSPEHNSYPILDNDFTRNQSVKNESNNTSLHNQSFCEINAQNECRFQKIQPTHLDYIPLLTLDASSIVTNDYKESGLIRDYSAVILTADIDEPLHDTPATISPYEKQAIPFYEYINKENITPEADAKIETTAITETVEETEIIFSDETLQGDTIDRGGNRSLEGEALHPKPNINQFTEISATKHIAKAEETDDLHRNFIQGDILNVFNSQRYFSSNPEPPTDWHSSQDPPPKDEPQNSSISSALSPGGDRRTLDLPLNTAISANQNPEEYYNMSFPEEYVTESQSIPVQRLFAECPVTQNIILSALPQIELEEVSRKTERISDNILSRKDSSNIIPELKKEDSIIQEESTAINTEESVKKDSISCSESAIPLSLLLKRIREQNRLDYCRKIIAKAEIKVEGTKKFTCPPPLDKSKSKTSVKPCQPKPKPACDPCKPSPCPTKKDPCAKFLPIFLSTIFRYDLALDSLLNSKETSSYNKDITQLTPVALLTRDIVKRMEKLGEKLKFLNNNDVTDLKDVIIYARDFEPWIPIPSWPIPEKEKAKPFVCPKEGCKVPVSRTNKPCKEKQCEGISKKSFALSEVLSSPIVNSF